MKTLDRLLRPKSIAVIGGGPWCEAVIERCKDADFPGAIWPVHPHREEMAGLPTFRCVVDLPEAPDATFIGVNRMATIDVVQALCGRGAGGAVCFASGFKEAEDGAGLQQRLAGAAGTMPFLGPNCYGFINNLDGAALWPDGHGLAPVERGVAVIGQSSNVLLNLSMQQRGLPIAYLIAAGNQAKVGMAAIGFDLLDDDRVTALGLHIEGFCDIPAFEALAARAEELGKPIVALKVGRSNAARQATLSHTASLAGSEAGAKALMARLGIARAESLTAFLAILGVMHLHGRRRFQRIASLSCSGGEASLMADAAENLPLTFPPLTDAQKTALNNHLGDAVTLANPLDYHTDIWRNLDAMRGVFAAMASEQADIICLVLDQPREDRCNRADWDIAMEAALTAKKESGGAFALVTSLAENMPEHVADWAYANEIVPLFGFDDTLKALASTQALEADSNEPILLAEHHGMPTTLAEADAKQQLAAFGLRVPKAGRAASAEEAAELAETIGFPVVLKGEGAAHKSEAGLVRLGLSAKQQVLEAAGDMTTDGFLVEEMIAGSIAELLVGIVHDPAHGFVLTLGAGGTLTELLGDTASLLIPSSREAVETALSKLKIARLLEGHRGKPCGDLRPVLDAIMTIQAYVVAHADRVREVEINPLLVTPKDAIAADALIVRTE